LAALKSFIRPDFDEVALDLAMIAVVTRAESPEYAPESITEFEKYGENAYLGKKCFEY